MKKYALIKDGHRLVLDRMWGGYRNNLTFCMLNPSLADAEQDDPTLRRCINFAKRWGFGSVQVVNLFTLVSPQPKDLLDADQPYHPENIAVVECLLEETQGIVLGWGANLAPLVGKHREYLKEMSRVLQCGACDPLCLGVTKAGFPKHPLYLSQITEPIDTPSCVWTSLTGEEK